jgi:hypothetical protein
MSFERIVKEVDVLTYNARSVLNALIRSVLRYGTSNGYTVVKSGVELKLTRNDIYLLYRLYNEWAGLGFEKDTFEAACDNVREKFMPVANVNPLLVSDADDDELLHAVVTHSKILYLNSSNKKNDNQYWIEQIINAADKTVILNSSPIPVNLRTPVFDENMEVDKYSQYETYLLPMGYYMSLILGSAGDETDHVGGGRNWWFDVDNEFKVSSPAVVLGGDNGTDRFTHRVAHDESGNLSSYSLAYGYNTKLIGDYDTVGGVSTFVFGSRSHGISSASMLQANYAGIYAGFSNQVHADNGMTAGGEDLTVLGTHGFAANRSNTVGYPGHLFKVPDLKKIDENCEVVVNVCESETSKTLTKYNPTNVLDIYANQNELTPVSWSKFKVGDKVIIYDQTINDKNYMYWFGAELRHQITTITGIDTTNIAFTRLILKDNIKYSEIGVDGGRVAKYSSAQYARFGTHSTALNYLTIAAGVDQTVVGTANYPVVNPNFIVGTGYIPDGDEIQSQYIGIGAFGTDADGYIHSKVYRRNAFMVARDYIHETTSDYIMMGMVNNQNQTDIGHWVATTDDPEHRELYLEVADGSEEVAWNDPNDENPDTNDYQQYHTSHIGLSNTRMVLGRFTDRSKDWDKSCLAAINFYDKRWFAEHDDVNQFDMPRNTALELIGENAIRELKTNFNITNGFVKPDGYICQSRYAPDKSYAVWRDNPIANMLYAENEYIAISSANTLSMYSSNLVLLASKSKVAIEGPRFEISPATTTIGTLALTGDGKSHCHDWICGCGEVNNVQQPDFARVMYAGFLIATLGDVWYGYSHNILPTRDLVCWGLEEFALGSASAHILSSVGGNNGEIDNYKTECQNESVKLILPGPSNTEHIHPVLMRYKEETTNPAGIVNPEIMKVDKLALMDDVVTRRTMQGALHVTGDNTPSAYRWVKVANVTVPAPVGGVQNFAAGSFIIMASGSKGCAKREIHFNIAGVGGGSSTPTVMGYSIDSPTSGRAYNQKACGAVKAVPVNTPSETEPAHYGIWVQIYNLDFFSIYQSSFNEGQGVLLWEKGVFALNDITDTNLVRAEVQDANATTIANA